MTISSSDKDTLRLINAFEEIKSRGTRRAVLLLLEELAQKDAAARETARKGN